MYRHPPKLAQTECTGRAADAVGHPIRSVAHDAGSVAPVRWGKRAFAWAILLSLLGVGGDLSAFEVFPFVQNGETLYLKWGDNHAGTPGPTVFWSLIPPGTPGSAGFCADACPGSSVADLQFEIAPVLASHRAAWRPWNPISARR